jgi:hypothetical protein
MSRLVLFLIGVLFTVGVCLMAAEDATNQTLGAIVCFVIGLGAWLRLRP